MIEDIKRILEPSRTSNDGISFHDGRLKFGTGGESKAGGNNSRGKTIPGFEISAVLNTFGGCINKFDGIGAIFAEGRECTDTEAYRLFSFSLFELCLNTQSPRLVQ